MTAASVLVSKVTRCWAMIANIVFQWLRDPRYVPDPEVPTVETPCFLPVEIVDRPRREDTSLTADAKLAQSTIEIDISGAVTGCGSAELSIPMYWHG